MTKADFSGIENKELIEKINETKTWFFEITQ